MQHVLPNTSTAIPAKMVMHATFPGSTTSRPLNILGWGKTTCAHCDRLGEESQFCADGNGDLICLGGCHD